MRNLFSYLLIISVVLVTVPRGWVHDCDHLVSDHTDQHDDGAHFQQDDCFACEYDLDFVDLHISKEFKVSGTFETVIVLGKESVSLAEVEEATLLRGPPALA